MVRSAWAAKACEGACNSRVPPSAIKIQICSSNDFHIWKAEAHLNVAWRHTVHVTRIWNVHVLSFNSTALFWQSHPQWRSVDIESELPQAKRVQFEEGTPRRSMLEGNFSFRKDLPATFYGWRILPWDALSSGAWPYWSLQERNRQGTSECQDAPEGLHANKTAPIMTYPIYFQTRKYVTNLYLHGTEVTRSFATFGGSCAPGMANAPTDLYPIIVIQYV